MLLPARVHADAPLKFDPHARIADDEWLFRCVQAKYSRVVDGKLRLGTQAFLDKSHRISVDRARLCHDDPNHTQEAASDGVCRLLAGAVRAIDAVVQNDSKGKPVAQHAVDIEPEPLIENIAHAVICGHPAITGRKAFQRLQESLAFLACDVIERDGWDIAPSREYSQS